MSISDSFQEPGTSASGQAENGLDGRLHRPGDVHGQLLGIIETFAKAYISTDLSDAIVFLALIVVLLVKPTGLLGKYVPEKV